MDVNSTDWFDFYKTDDPNKCWECLKGKLLNLWNKHAPLKTIRIKKYCKQKTLDKKRYLSSNFSS